ncbi:MAG: tetratricopeptide repeat protein [Candidatus Omnitrophica bacterium]|nr:tetratricopeptide repeat protein [Candidatus Omnitrophota bacterium]
MNTSKKICRKIAVVFIPTLLISIAIPLMNSVYSEEPLGQEQELFVAKKAFEDGFYEVSIGLLQRFLSNYPDSPKSAEAGLLIGRCYFQQSRFLEALNKFEEVIHQPSAANIKDSLFYWIAEVHFKGNSFEKATSYYKKIIDEFPKSEYLAASYYSLGWCLFQQQAYSEALKYFRIVQERYPKEPMAADVPLKIIECLYNLKDYNKLKEEAQRYLKVFANDTLRLSYIYFYLAESEYYLDNFEQALTNYSLVISTSHDPKTQVLAMIGQGWSYLKLKKYKEARDSFGKINPENLEERSLDVFLLGKALTAAAITDYDEAKNAYDELIKNSRDALILIQAYIGKAEMLYELADYVGAINLCLTALDRADSESIPGDMLDKLHYNLAWCYLKQSQFKDAIREFQKIAATSEDKIVKISALCQIGDTYLDAGDFTKAQEAYSSLLKDYPDSLYSDYVQYQLGLSFLKSSDYDAAILNFFTLIKNYPKSKLLEDAYYALGLAYFQKQDYNSSREVFAKFQSALKESNFRPQALYLLGSSLYNLGRFTEAIEVFKDIAKTYSHDTELVQKAEYEIADCFSRMGNEKEAIARFTALRSKYPDSSLTAEIMWWLGDYYYRQGNLNLAHRYFSALIRDFSRSNLVADAYYALGCVLEEESRYEEAIENFKRVNELGKSDLAGQAAVSIARIYAKENKKELATETYEKILQDYPHLGGIVYSQMADLFYNTGNFTQALEYYRKSLDLLPLKEMPRIHLRIAEALENQGKSSEAIEEYLKVSYLFPEDTALSLKAFLRIAAIYEEEGKYKEALLFYKKVGSQNTEEAKYANERVDWINKHIR